MRGHFTPDAKFSFPPREEKKKDRLSQRYFQLRWLRAYPWLVYFAKDNGGYCLPCLFFSPDECSGQLYERPLTCFTSASDVLKRHADQKAHKDSVVKQSSFLATYAYAQPNVLQQLQDKHSQQAAENMDKLRSILSCIEYCGRQGIALRGTERVALVSPISTHLFRLTQETSWLWSVSRWRQVMSVFFTISTHQAIFKGNIL